MQEIVYFPPFTLILLTHLELPFSSGDLGNSASASFGAKLEICVCVCVCVWVCVCVCVWSFLYSK